MKLIPLTQNKFAQVDDSDFNWLNQWKWFAYYQHGIWYARRAIYINKKQKMLFMHRIILGLIDPQIQGDHEDRNGLNNQRYNLRIATHSENTQNRRKPRSTSVIYSSEFRGVQYVKNGRKHWKASLKSDKNTIYLGVFYKEDQAARAYNMAAIKHHGEFACINIL